MQAKEIKSENKLKQLFSMLKESSKDDSKLRRLIQQIPVSELNIYTDTIILRIPFTSDLTFTTTVLGVACFFNNVAAVKYLLDKEVDPNTPCDHPPLCIAVNRNFLDIVTLLLNSKVKANPNIQNCESISSLHYAIRKIRAGGAPLVMLLLKHDADCNLPGNKKYTALHELFRVFENNYDDLTFRRVYFPLLLRHGARLEDIAGDKFSIAKFMVSHNLEFLYTVIIDHVKEKNSVHKSNAICLLDELLRLRVKQPAQNATIELLIQKLIEHFNDLTYEQKKLLFIMLAEIGMHSHAIRLIESGLDPNFTMPIVDDEGNKGNVPVLYCMVDRNFTEIARRLLEKGANPNQGFGNCSPLLLALCRDINPMANLLLSHNANPSLSGSVDNKDVTVNDYYPIHVAARRGNLELLVLLLEKYKLEINLRTVESGFTALSLAVAFDQPKVVSVLLERGADLFCYQQISQSPIFAAIDKNNAAIFEILLKHYLQIISGTNLKVFELNTMLLHAALPKTQSAIRANIEKFLSECLTRSNPVNILAGLHPSLLLMACYNCIVYPDHPVDFDWLFHLASKYLPESLLNFQLEDCLLFCYLNDNKQLAKLLIDKYHADRHTQLHDGSNKTIQDWLNSSFNSERVAEDKLSEKSTDKTSDDKLNDENITNEAALVDTSTTTIVSTQDAGPCASASSSSSSSQQIAAGNPTSVASSLSIDSKSGFSTESSKHISGRQFLLDKGFTVEQINEMQRKRKPHSPTNVLRREGIFSEKSQKSECSWFCGRLHSSEVIEIENSENQFLWVPNIFDNDVREIFIQRRAKFDPRHIKPLTDIRHLQTISIDNTDYSLALYGEIVDPKSEKRLLLYKYSNLLIALHYLPDALHTNAAKKSLIESSKLINLSLKLYSSLSANKLA